MNYGFHKPAPNKKREVFNDALASHGHKIRWPKIIANGSARFLGSRRRHIHCLRLRSIPAKFLRKADSNFLPLWRRRSRRPDDAAARAGTNGKNEAAGRDRKSSGSRRTARSQGSAQGASRWLHAWRDRK